MDERLKFIAGLLDGEKMAVLCRRFGISRKTGYKILERYNSCGVEGLTDRSRRPYRHANQLPLQIETLIVRSKQERPHWGGPKRSVATAKRPVARGNHAGSPSSVHCALPQWQVPISMLRSPSVPPTLRRQRQIHGFLRTSRRTAPKFGDWMLDSQSPDQSAVVRRLYLS